jgi:hypothetical protein
MWAAACSTFLKLCGAANAFGSNSRLIQNHNSLLGPIRTCLEWGYFMLVIVTASPGENSQGIGRKAACSPLLADLTQRPGASELIARDVVDFEEPVWVLRNTISPSPGAPIGAKPAIGHSRPAWPMPLTEVYLVVLDVVELECAGFDIAQHHVGFVGVAAEVATAGDLPLRADLAQRARRGDSSKEVNCISHPGYTKAGIVGADTCRQLKIDAKPAKQGRWWGCSEQSGRRRM